MFERYSGKSPYSDLYIVVDVLLLVMSSTVKVKVNVKLRFLAPSAGIAEIEQA